MAEAAKGSSPHLEAKTGLPHLAPRTLLGQRESNTEWTGLSQMEGFRGVAGGMVKEDFLEEGVLEVGFEG